MRREPYTAIGIKRLPCTRCGQKPGYASWNVCADNVNGNPRFRVLCKPCDVAMNEMAMSFVFGAAGASKAVEYRKELGL